MYRLKFGLGIVECSIFLKMYQLASIVRHAQYSTTLLGSPDSSCMDVVVHGEKKKLVSCLSYEIVDVTFC